MNALDTLVNATTAMRTWADLEAAMRTGYVPTIHPETRRKRVLIRVCRAKGYGVFTGFRHQWAGWTVCA